MKTQNSKMPKFLKYTLGIIAIALFVIPVKIAAGGVMLGAMFNFGSLDFSDEEIRSLSDTIMETAMKQPELTAFHTVVPNIITGKNIVFLGLLDKIIKANEGCGTGKTSKQILAAQKKWAPEAVKMWLSLCTDELNETLGVYALHKGLDINDIVTNPTELAKFLVERISEAMVKDVLRILWFSDKTHSNFGDSTGTEIITAGVDVADYNIINGFFKQIFAAVATNPARRVTITANAAGTYTLQDTLTAGTASDVYRDLLNKAHPKLKGASNKIILSTTSLTDEYADFLESKDIDASYTRIEGGFSVLKRRGIDIISWQLWDDIIRSDFDNGTTYFLPHRAVLTTKENLLAGFDDPKAMTEVEMWYSKDLEDNNFRSKFKMDAVLAIDEYMEAAY